VRLATHFHVLSRLMKRESVGVVDFPLHPHALLLIKHKEELKLLPGQQRDIVRTKGTFQMSFELCVFFSYSRQFTSENFF
jgi:hypothetical protein